MTFEKLRELHPRIVYDSFSVEITEDEANTLSLSWSFKLESNQGETIVFEPSLSLNGTFSTLPTEVLHNLAFQIGLVELLSYWKAACPPEIVIKAGYLSADQITWWNDLLIKGLGEFFYTNQIDFTVDDLVKWTITETETTHQPSLLSLDSTKYLVPIGGGKDSAVTLELLRSANLPIELWAVNPIEASYQTAKIADVPLHPIFRTIDPQLLKLNAQGYLNGHTPFSAYLAFVYALVAALTGSKYVLVSNEVSANECNATYKGHEINHQYSKSFEFEQKFRQYAQAYLLPDYDYLSFLRPLHELQIAQVFSRLPQHFETFRSCNRGQKLGGIWCHECPKCLFAFAMLFPFVETDVLTTKIFNRNLFEDEKMVELALKLILPDREKPFECVGSYDESKSALWLATQKYLKTNRELPLVLQAVTDQVLSSEQDLQSQTEVLLKDWNRDHNLPSNLENILKTALTKNI